MDKWKSFATVESFEFLWIVVFLLIRWGCKFTGKGYFCEDKISNNLDNSPVPKLQPGSDTSTIARGIAKGIWFFFQNVCLK